ncbi:MAG: helix-turn-helix domain-containing protein [Alphaproteobacteria bacterium]|nr:helix-turn-helix domain-containing protein [Alphaproteobacteria bacterium]
MTDDILTIKELSSHLKTSEKTIYRILSKNEIPAFTVGNVWRFEKEAIDQWIKEKSKEAA